MAYAERYKLAVTGGSDFHGGNGYDGFPIGSVTVGADRLLALEALR
ncbi:hypothetical protein [Paenibacillus arenilitoris]|uniref:Metal-dependent phosphoesterase n=1 Tax=Paenibacillus arenilitoris TaxID=2772299 RepID=A0A927CHJ7_9BACL|nr:hypothetical protein [Paenibacillus arenilitoris]MBD2867639.1 hypothetical protein [Paenibacillus arenilitoris]